MGVGHTVGASLCPGEKCEWTVKDDATEDEFVLGRKHAHKARKTEINDQVSIHRNEEKMQCLPRKPGHWYKNEKR